MLNSFIWVLRITEELKPTFFLYQPVSFLLRKRSFLFVLRKRRSGLRSKVFVFVGLRFRNTRRAHDVQTKYFRNFRKLVSDIPIFSWNDE